ncbi:MAG: hypothetical protein J5705_01145 [Bacteroidaceae bacterium]|nr:hypothetical protein [Bacteroidaceae bacterium]
MKTVRIRVRQACAVIFAAVLLLWGCSWDEKFTTDYNCLLSFSADTVKMDTVFAGVASASDCFMIYNPNSAGVRLDAVLAGGSGSAFRINLDGQGGTQITGLEIPAGDSLFCFVSVNIPESEATELFYAFDSIRFVLESGKVQFVRLSAYGQNAVSLKGRRIEHDTTLTARLPYLVYDSLYVAEGATLTLAPGTRLYFHSGAVLDVAGRLVADGTVDSVILMRGDRLDDMQTIPPIAYDLVSGQWGGIRLRTGSYGNLFRYCDIHSSEFGIKADSASAAETKFCLYSSTVHNVDLNCIEATGCRIEVANSQITNAGISCVDIAGGWSEFTFCTIAGFSLWSVGSQAVLITDHRGQVEVPFTGARFSNCIITGRHDDEFLTGLSDSIKKLDNCYVGNSLVMTIDTLDTHYHSVLFDSHERENGGAANFKGKTRDGYKSLYALDSLSRARGIADSLSVIWPVDLKGIPRPPSGADAGCFQFVPSKK